MLEIISSSMTDSSKINNGDLDRIELVSALSEGGLTPSVGLARLSWESVNIPHYIMIRPHNRGFQYDLYDLEVMKEDVKTLDEYATGFVLGILDKNGLPDIDAMEMVLTHTNKNITFHRAFDEVSDFKEALRILNSWGRCERILTSGGKGTVVDNIANINEILKINGNIKIMLGSGVNLENLPKLMRDFPQCDFHIGSAVRYEGRVDTEIDREKIEKAYNIYKGED